jgi:hypothetical protein
MNSLKNLFSRLRLNESSFLGLILLACFLLVSLTIKGYGASYDETSEYGFADANLNVYKNLIFEKPYAELFDQSDIRFKGPAYWFVGKIASSGLNRIFPALDGYDAWHIVNFMTFLFGVWFLFCLARRFVSPRPALAASLLYLTQPLLWGHGIMNAKDAPFMTFFLAAVLAGIKMVEVVSQAAGIGRKWGSLWRGRRRIWIGLALLAALLALADRIFGHFITLPPVTGLVSAGFDPHSTSFLHALFLRFAAHSDTVPLATYIAKVMLNVDGVEFLLLAGVVGGGVILWLVRTRSSNRWIFLAGIVAGMTISIRALGPAAIGLVGLYALVRLRKKAFAPLMAYSGVSLLVAYAFWPFLWSSPIDHFLETLRVVANFPWPGQVRFEGSDYLATDLPWYYLPKLIGIQLTLPLLILAVAGMALLIRSIWLRRLNWGLASVPLLWFLAPLAGVLIAHPSMYDNFRQFLFIMPPLFLFAALAIEAVLGWIKSGLGRGAMVGLILLPGIVAGIWLHPFEYIYYNALVGWTGQVDRTYETDYWFTSLCEAGRYLSAVAPAGAKVAVTDDVAKTFLVRCTSGQFLLFVERAAQSQISPDFSAVNTRYDDDQDYFRKLKPIEVIGRGNTPFTVIRQAP